MKESKLLKICPPCNTDYFGRQFDGKTSTKKRPMIVSLGQFRPEKNHIAQLHILQNLLEKHILPKDFKMVIIGSCRNAKDMKRAEELKTMAKNLNIKDFIEFEINKSPDFVRKLLSDASIGIHTMIDEHFGISLVEMMVIFL